MSHDFAAAIAVQSPESSDAAAPSLARRALSGHAAIGLIASALIYIIALTGTIIVIDDRWQRWEEPNVVEYTHFTPEAGQIAMAETLKLEKGKTQTTHLYVRMPTPDLPRAVVTTDNAAWYVDQNGKPVAREAHSWTEFLRALHIHLTLPMIWGMLLVGILGVALAALAVTGVLALPKIFKDGFRLRARHDSQIARADWHNRLGTWTLPFTLVIALTGAIIGLGYAGVGLIAQTDTGGDIEAAYSKIFGEEPEHDATPAPLANAGRALATVQAQYPETSPIYAIVHDPGTAGQFIQILAEHPRRLIYSEAYSFNGAGEHIGKVGLSDGPLGRQATASLYNLHFGNYAGLPVEIAYIAMGLTMCAITATGTTLWLQKRRRKGIKTDRLSANWSVTIWGVPIALVLALWQRWIIGPDTPITGIFWITLLAAILVASIRPRWIKDRQLRLGLSATLIITAFGHAFAFRPEQTAVLFLDVVILATGLVLALLTLRHSATTSRAPTRLAAESR